jgi:hypothetical protein
MFGFQLKIMHVFKDNVYDDNKNVIKSIYQVPIIDDFGLKWMENFEKFTIVVKNLSKTPQNIILMPKIVAYVAKALLML